MNSAQPSSANSEPIQRLEKHDNNLSSCAQSSRDRDSYLNKHTFSVESSPASPPSPVTSTYNDVSVDSMNDECEAEIPVDSSSLDIHEVKSDPKKKSKSIRSLLRLNHTKERFCCINVGCGKRFEAKDSLLKHEHQCQSTFDKLTFTQLRQIVVCLKGTDGITKGQENDNCGSTEEVSNVSGDKPTEKSKEYRIQIIENVTTHRCLHCNLEFSSVMELQRHLVTCPKNSCHIASNSRNSSWNSNTKIKHEPSNILYQKQMRRDATDLNGNSNIYRCNQCGQQFKDEWILRCHKFTHLRPENWAKRKRMRTSFNHHQHQTLTSYFTINQNPDAKVFEQIAQNTGLHKRVLKVWFQNARAKQRKNMPRTASSKTDGTVPIQDDNVEMKAGLVASGALDIQSGGGHVDGRSFFDVN